MADGTPMKPGFYNMDCMEAMKQFPDGFFDLAIVDPPYGDGNSNIGNGNRFGQRFDRYKEWDRFAGGTTFKKYSSVERTGGGTLRNTAKKSLRGMLPRNKHILMSCSASHAIKSYGAVTILHSHRQGAF
jgi:hypothetical protein